MYHLPMSSLLPFFDGTFPKECQNTKIHSLQLKDHHPKYPGKERHQWTNWTFQTFNETKSLRSGIQSDWHRKLINEINWSHLRWNDIHHCYKLPIFSGMVTIGWLVKFRGRIFESYLHINLRCSITLISHCSTIQLTTY